MSKRAPLLSMSLLLTAHPALADCPEAIRARTPADVAMRLDHYRNAARQPGTYRALAGLGDPNLDGYDGGGPVYELTPRQRMLIGRMAPWLGASGQIYSYDQGECRLDHALRLGEERLTRLGPAHPYLAQWLLTQQTVFSACRERRVWHTRHRPARPVFLPMAMPTADAGIARLQRDDRAYQAAALAFYRRDPGARRAFRAIAGSPSPHAPVARFMLAAIEARDMDVYSWESGPQAQARRARHARAALREAQAILADPRLAEIHGLAQGLIGYLGYHDGDARTRRAQVRVTLDALDAPLGRIRASRVAADRYARAVNDVQRLHGDFEGPAWWLTGAVPDGMEASRTMARAARRRPMAAWLLFPRSPFEVRPWAVARLGGTGWRRLAAHADARVEREAGEAWAVLRDSLARSYDPAAWTRIDALIRAAQSCPSDERLASLATLFYHQVRTAVMYPAPGARRGGFETALARLEAFPWRDSGYFHETATDMLQYLAGEGRIGEARRLRDRIAPRGYGWWGAENASLLLAEDEDAFVAELAAQPVAEPALVNLLSIGTLARLAARADVPRRERARFARVAWARLYAMQRPIPRQLDRLMRTLNPELTAGWISPVGAPPRSRWLLLDVLRSPGLNTVITTNQRDTGVPGWRETGPTGIDVYNHSDNNWWCAWEPDRHRRLVESTLYFAFFLSDDERPEPRAIAGSAGALRPLLRASWLWRSQDAGEQAALSRISSAPQLLAERAIVWRTGGWFGFGAREGQDEALALAVRATRYGCQRQGGHGRWSRAAFALLRSRFPQSAAARRTRYWFDCAHFTYGCRRPEDVEEERVRRALAWL